MRRITWFWLAVLAFVGPLAWRATAWAGERVPRRAGGQVIVDFSKPQPEFPGKRGVFRDPNDPPDLQFISEDLVTEKVPEKKELGFLQLTYVVEGLGTYNGYWFQYEKGKGDWERFKDGALVLRLRMGPNCTPRFKFELKTADGEDGVVTVFPKYVSLGDPETRKALADKGYADVVIPLTQFRVKKTRLDPNSLQVVTESKAPNLKHVTELTLVFEQNQIPKDQRKGVLLINSIRLVERESDK